MMCQCPICGIEIDKNVGSATTMQAGSGCLLSKVGKQCRRLHYQKDLHLNSGRSCHYCVEDASRLAVTPCPSSDPDVVEVWRLKVGALFYTEGFTISSTAYVVRINAKSGHNFSQSKVWFIQCVTTIWYAQLSASNWFASKENHISVGRREAETNDTNSSRVGWRITQPLYAPVLHCTVS